MRFSLDVGNTEGEVFVMRFSRCRKHRRRGFRDEVQ